MRMICFCSGAPPAVRDARGDFSVAPQLIETIIGNLAAEIIAGDVFDLMRFVKHHGAVFGKHTAEIVLLERKVREEKMMIHDDQVSFSPRAGASPSENSG